MLSWLRELGGTSAVLSSLLNVLVFGGSCDWLLSWLRGPGGTLAAPSSLLNVLVCGVSRDCVLSPSPHVAAKRGLCFCLYGCVGTHGVASIMMMSFAVVILSAIVGFFSLFYLFCVLWPEPECLRGWALTQCRSYLADVRLCQVRHADWLLSPQQYGNHEIFTLVICRYNYFMFGLFMIS